jgi:predicted TIM-barrel fold metal-dependent hydrolase
MSNIALISADSHAGLRREDYFDYMEKKYHDDLTAYVAEKRQEVGLAEQFFKKQLATLGDEEKAKALSADRERRAQYAVNLSSRVITAEKDGFIAEVLYPDSSADNEIPFSGVLGGTGRYSRELYTAGLRAYNQWLGENSVPDRQVGLATFDAQDTDAALFEVKRARSLGLRGVMPEWDGIQGQPLYDEALDPVWAACVEDGLAVHFHVGSGLPGNVGEQSIGTGYRGMIAFSEMVFWCRRPLWHMIWSGILERFPDLRLVFAECFADWIPRTLGHLDWQWETARAQGLETVPLRPSEYWARQCHVCAHAASLEEWKSRRDIGVDQLMYGTDFPHGGSPWGISTEFLQATVGNLDISESEARAILGENAIRLYDLDMSKLAPVIDRIGHAPSEILGVAATTDEIVAEFPPKLRSKVFRPPSML